MRKYIILIFGLYFAQPSQAQDAKVQQWKAIVEQGKKDTLVLGALDSLFNYYSRVITNDSVYYFAQKMFDLAGELHNKQLQWMVAGRRLSERYFEQGKIDSALQIQFKALNVYDKLKDSNKIFSIYTTIGNAHKEYSDYTKAIHYYTKSYTIAKAMQFNYGIWAASLNLGFVYAQINQLDSALYFANMAYDYGIKPVAPNSFSVSEIYLGIVHNKLGNY